MEVNKAGEQLIDYSKKHHNYMENITTSHGKPVGDRENVLTAGERGPLLLQDFTYLDEIAHFDHERAPERVVHAKGAGAFGYFEVIHDISKYTKAAVFEKVGKKTPIAVRFSTVTGNMGSPDTMRDPRGFALKFYTEHGNWDLVGNNTPIFFIRDPILFPSFIHSQKRNPVTNLKDPNMFWDFLTLRPESVHQTSFLFGDRGTPDGFRHLNGYGSNTFKFLNAQGDIHYVKFHYKTNQGIRNLTSEQAVELAGINPDYATQDLYNAIANGNFPSWTFFIQVMTPEQAESCKFNPFDVTKVWPHSEFQLIPVGRFILNRNPLNYFAEVEQLAFSAGHFIPGIEASPDKMLQGRLISYDDTQRHRLGANFLQIPVNAPYKVSNYQRDGPQPVHSNFGGAPNYFPNSFSGPLQENVHKESLIKIEGDAKRYDSSEDDNYTQCGVFWRKVLDEAAKDRLIDNMSKHLSFAAEFIQERAVRNFSKVDSDYGQRLKAALDK